MIDPESLDDYLAAGGYQALRRSSRENDPEALINAIVDSGLRGRGRRRLPHRA